MTLETSGGGPGKPSNHPLKQNNLAPVKINRGRELPFVRGETDERELIRAEALLTINRVSGILQLLEGDQKVPTSHLVGPRISRP